MIILIKSKQNAKHDDVVQKSNYYKTKVSHNIKNKIKNQIKV